MVAVAQPSIQQQIFSLASSKPTDESLGQGTKRVLAAQYFAPHSALMAASRVYLSSFFHSPPEWRNYALLLETKLLFLYAVDGQPVLLKSDCFLSTRSQYAEVVFLFAKDWGRKR